MGLGAECFNRGLSYTSWLRPNEGCHPWSGLVAFKVAGAYFVYDGLSSVEEVNEFFCVCQSAQSASSWAEVVVVDEGGGIIRIQERTVGGWWWWWD